MTAVAFLGLGLMGAPMARRLLDAGHELVVWNRSADKAAPLEEAGAHRASTPREAVTAAEVVITMLADPVALATVTEGPDGVGAGVGAGTTVLEMSTVGPAAVHRLRRALPDGVVLIDSPVLGSTPQAADGSLQLFVGGDAGDVERWLPLLGTFGAPTHVGPLGAGAAAKLVVNSTLGGTLALLGEALALADGLGLDRSSALDVLARSPLGGQVERRRPALESGEFPLRFRLRLAGKDLDLVTAAAGDAGIDLRVGPAARSWIGDATDAGWGDEDYSSVVAFITGAPRPA
jgi:3-hydroxyisobutyrate dehydrogenase-like beta-hydroxyacid dehydrogenase